MKKARVAIILFSVLLLFAFPPGCGGGGDAPLPEGGGGGETLYKDYYVYGGNTYVSGEWGYYPKIEENGYVLLGSSDGSDTFAGDYDYYVIVVKGKTIICLDSVMICGSSCSYPGSSTTGNTFDHQNIGGQPDGLVAVIGDGNGGGYVLIVSKVQDDFITLYCPDL